MNSAVYPGSFDPITLGHVDIIQRISTIYDQVTVLVANSNEKKYLFSGQQRLQMIKESIRGLKNVKVEIFDGLTVNYLKKNKQNVIIRGLRAVADFEYELAMANMNKQLAPEIETMIVFANPLYHYVASRAIKEVAVHGGDLMPFVPKVVCEAFKNILTKKSTKSRKG